MNGSNRRSAIIVALALGLFGFVTLTPPGIGNATECGWGTVLDAGSNTCVAAQQPPPPPPPAPAWNGDLTPGFSVGVCVPIPVPFAPSICAGI
jgi:hypothetical protein